MYVCMHTYIHVHAYLHTPIHTYMHVHTYMHKTIHKRSEVSKPCLPPPAAPRTWMRPFQPQCPRAGRSPSSPSGPPRASARRLRWVALGPWKWGPRPGPTCGSSRPSHLRTPPVSSRATVGRLRPDARLPPAVRGLLDSQRVNTSYGRCRGRTHRAPPEMLGVPRAQGQRRAVEGVDRKVSGRHLFPFSIFLFPFPFSLSLSPSKPAFMPSLLYLHAETPTLSLLRQHHPAFAITHEDACFPFNQSTQ